VWQYPIPSDRSRPEGRTEEIIGKWLKRQGADLRDQVVVATKVTGGSRVTSQGIREAVDGSLRRLGVDRLGLLQTHWPARYSPQSNWGQSLSYRKAGQRFKFADFDEITQTLGDLVAEGKIRGYGFCNDNAVGLVASAEASKRLGVTPPCLLQNDFSIINRRIEENGVAEASAPWHYNAGFFAYNSLAGGVLTGKYLESPPLWDAAARAKLGLVQGGDRFGEAPGSSFDEAARDKGRFDEQSWGRTLYRYRSGPADEATRAYLSLARTNGLSLMELSLRWALGREAVTSVLLGSSTVGQLDAALGIAQKAAREPLSDELLWEIDRVHMRNRLPIFSSTDVPAEWGGTGGIGEPIP